MGKKKKKAQDKRPDRVLAYDRFCDFDYNREHYEWQSWGLVVRHLRDFLGMDQDIFGRLLRGYTRGQIGRYEKEEGEPPIDFWVKMIRTFGLNLNWVLTGKGKPYVEDHQDSEECKRAYKWIVLINEKQDFLRELKGC